MPASPSIWAVAAQCELNCQHKVPLNYKGFSPGALIGLGWQFNSHWAATAHMLGDAGMMFQLSYDWR